MSIAKPTNKLTRDCKLHCNLLKIKNYIKKVTKIKYNDVPMFLNNPHIIMGVLIEELIKVIVTKSMINAVVTDNNKTITEKTIRLSLLSDMLFKGHLRNIINDYNENIYYSLHIDNIVDTGIIMFIVKKIDKNILLNEKALDLICYLIMNTICSLISDVMNNRKHEYLNNAHPIKSLRGYQFIISIENRFSKDIYNIVHEKYKKCINMLKNKSKYSDSYVKNKNNESYNLFI